MYNYQSKFYTEQYIQIPSLDKQCSPWNNGSVTGSLSNAPRDIDIYFGNYTNDI